MWHIDALVGNDRKTNNETTAIARKQPTRNSEVLLVAVFSMWSALRLYPTTTCVHFSECSVVEYSRVK
jgi:hypothetical protein